MERTRRLPIGAEVIPGEGVHFRVWAPDRKAVAVVFNEGDAAALRPDGDGYFSGLVPAARPGALYRYRLDQEEPAYPDPASRFQPTGPHGPSQVIDPSSFPWSDAEWPGLV